MTDVQKDFIVKVGLLAASDMKKSGILASLTIAQAILESGWGKSGLTIKANALFGIKAGNSWTGRVYSSQTQECYDGLTFTTIPALFRAYDCWADSVADHSRLFTTSSRYENLRGLKDYKLACKYVWEDGYATDPNYTDKLITLVETYGLKEYDTVGSARADVAPSTYKLAEINNLVAIRAGAVYGGLTAVRGKVIPNWVIDGKKYTALKISTHYGEREALLKEINSWVAIKYLNCVV